MLKFENTLKMAGTFRKGHLGPFSAGKKSICGRLPLDIPKKVSELTIRYIQYWNFDLFRWFWNLKFKLCYSLSLAIFICLLLISKLWTLVFKWMVSKAKSISSKTKWVRYSGTLKCSPWLIIWIIIINEKQIFICTLSYHSWCWLRKP